MTIGIGYVEKARSKQEDEAPTRQSIDGTVFATVGGQLAGLPVAVMTPPYVTKAMDTQFKRDLPIFEALIHDLERWTIDRNLSYLLNDIKAAQTTLHREVPNTIAEMRWPGNYPTKHLPQATMEKLPCDQSHEKRYMNQPGIGMVWQTTGIAMATQSMGWMGRIWRVLVKNIFSQSGGVIDTIVDKHTQQYVNHKDPKELFGSADAKFVFTLKAFRESLIVWESRDAWPDFSRPADRNQTYAHVREQATIIQQLKWLNEMMSDISSGIKEYYFLSSPSGDTTTARQMSQIRNFKVALDLGVSLTQWVDLLIDPITPADIIQLNIPLDYYNIVSTPDWMMYKYGESDGETFWHKDGNDAPRVNGYNVSYAIPTTIKTGKGGKMGPYPGVFTTKHISSAASLIKVPLMSEHMGANDEPGLTTTIVSEEEFTNQLMNIESMSQRQPFVSGSLMDEKPVYLINARKTIGGAPMLKKTWVEATIQWPGPNFESVIQGELIVPDYLRLAYGASVNTSDMPQIFPGKFL